MNILCWMLAGVCILVYLVLCVVASITAAQSEVSLRTKLWMVAVEVCEFTASLCLFVALATNLPDFCRNRGMPILFEIACMIIAFAAAFYLVWKVFAFLEDRFCKIESQAFCENVEKRAPQLVS